MKKIINVNEMKEIINKINEFNKLQLDSIQFVYNNKVVDIPEKTIDDFAFTGLNNRDFLVLFNWDKGYLNIL